MAETDPVTKDLDDLFKQARSAKRLLEPGWFLDLAFFQGQQWVSWAGDRLHKPVLAGNRITVVENRIAGTVRTELAKMTKNRPVFTCTPNTGEEEDANAAELAERVMRFMWRHLKMHEQSLKALEWSRICSAGFLKCYWDSTIGDPQNVLVGPDGKVLTDDQGKARRGDKTLADSLSQQLQTQVQAKQVAKGDVRVEVRSPFQMFIDPICDSFPDAEWAIEESIKSQEYVLRRFGVKLKADTAANPGLVEARMIGSSAVQGASGGYKGVRVREYWSKPSSKHPHGCRMVWSQGRVLETDNHPFDPMPYVMLTGVPVPGRLWPMSVVELLRGPQTELNKVRSQMAENRNRVGNPTLLASKQAVQDPEKFLDASSAPGGVYFYDDIGSPNALIRYLEAPQLPEYVSNEVTLIGQAIEDISGQHEVTNANVPPGVTAASAITLLQEADDTRLGLAMQDYEEQIGRFGEKILKLVANFYTDARTIKIGGGDDAWEIFDFKGAMLKGNTTVEVQAGSAFPQSKAAKQAMIQDWMTFFVQSGNPPQGRKLSQFLRDSGMGATERLVQEYSDTEDQVNREDSLMSLGADLPINDYDDDQGHIDGHESFQRQARYATFSPQIKQNIETHVAAHRARLSQTQQQAMALQAQAQGQPPPEAAQAQQQQQAQQAQVAQQGQMAQQQQQQAGASQQQGYQAAGAEQSQRQQEELHQQKMQQAQDQHNQALRQSEEQHQTRLTQLSKPQPQPSKSQPSGAPNGR
jgi:hypothetical protein